MALKAREKICEKARVYWREKCAVRNRQLYDGKRIEAAYVGTSVPGQGLDFGSLKSLQLGVFCDVPPKVAA